MTRKRFPHHISLYLDAEQHRQLRQLVKNTSVDASKHLRAALALYLEHRQSKKKEKPKKPSPPRPHPHDRAFPTGEVLPVVAVWSD